MLKEKVCLVLGAGASIDCGFPTGRDLIYLIVQEAKSAKKGSRSMYFEALDQIIKRVPETERFLNFTQGIPSSERLFEIYASVLENSYPASIDEFAATNQTRFFKEITKLGIAIVLNQFESQANTFEFEESEIGRNDTKTKIKIPKQNWYQQLWHHISSGCDNLEQLKNSLSNLRIITFNYDRSLEHFLYCCALNMYRMFFWDSFGFEKTDADQFDIFFKENLTIDHVYGQLGQLKWQPNSAEAFFNYGDTLKNHSHSSSIERLIYIAESIKTLAEIPSFDEAAKCIDFDELSSDLLQAKQIHFLGFGYHPQNMRFFSQEYLKCEFDDFDIKAGGTCKGIGKSRQIEIRNEIGSWLYRSKLPANSEQLNFVDCDISDYIKTHF